MGRGLGRRGDDRTPKKGFIGEASASPLVERGYVSITSQATRAQYVWHVQDLGGPEEMRLAMATQIVGIPRYGERHSTLNVPVSNVRADPVKGSTTQAYVTVEYGLQVEGGGGWFNNEPSETEPAQIEVVSTVQGATTEFDVNRAQILVHHLEEAPDGEGPPYLRPQGGEVAYQQPMHMVIFRRRENFSPGVAVPGGRGASVAYVGHTNFSLFLGGAEHTWLCVKMNGYTDDGGVTWNNTYEFQRREGQTLHATTKPTVQFPEGVAWDLDVPGWNSLTVYRDPNTGESIKVTARHEVAVVKIYKSANFHDLRLYLP